ncbi:hypothetical protein CONLIGDRAFT_224439 [Coniochaeta ligniaria NRRL 30616]|uniref:Uncharacterized protein n=1 Tax=Coniochaeta ligniaria NRRL 30616 TaxID=1408157 RepID=A0A1J7J4D5_9PEZI|nr:hypothetical protein CONLIGDRAFT_224439 [Coniochaeta ligniaria NRRL 30616]
MPLLIAMFHLRFSGLHGKAQPSPDQSLHRTVTTSTGLLLGTRLPHRFSTLSSSISIDLTSQTSICHQASEPLRLPSIRRDFMDSGRKIINRRSMIIKKTSQDGQPAQRLARRPPKPERTTRQAKQPGSGSSMS